MRRAVVFSACVHRASYVLLSPKEPHAAGRQAGAVAPEGHGLVMVLFY